MNKMLPQWCSYIKDVQNQLKTQKAFDLQIFISFISIFAQSRYPAAGLDQKSRLGRTLPQSR